MNYSQITDTLYIGKTPGITDYPALRGLGVRLVINMRFEKRPLPDPGPNPLTLLWLPVFDSPLIPIPVQMLVRGARAALETIRSGGKVYTHCQGGVHRGPAMGAAILIAQGCTPLQAIELIQQRRESADPQVWYIRRRIMRFAAVWNGRAL